MDTTLEQMAKAAGQEAPGEELFPRWQADLDPALGGAHGNALFLAFRQRRQSGILRSMWILWNLRWMAALALLFALLYVGISTAWLPAFFIFWGAALFLGLDIPVLRDKLLRLRDRSNHMPRRVTGVFAPTGYKEKAAIDLWLAGASGREVLEAVYLERREGNAASSAVVLGAVFILMCGHVWQVPFSPRISAVTTTLMAFFFAELFLTWYVYLGYRIRLNFVDDHLKFWRGEDAARSILNRRFLTLAAFWIFCITFAWEFHLAKILYAAWVAEPWARTLGEEWSRIVLGTVELQTLSIHFLLGGIALHAIRPVFRDAFQQGFHAAMKTANHDFARFMTCSVLQDQDGPWAVEWARRHRQGRYNLSYPSTAIGPKPYFIVDEKRERKEGRNP